MAARKRFGCSWKCSKYTRQVQECGLCRVPKGILVQVKFISGVLRTHTHSIGMLIILWFWKFDEKLASKIFVVLHNWQCGVHLTLASKIYKRSIIMFEYRQSKQFIVENHMCLRITSIILVVFNHWNCYNLKEILIEKYWSFTQNTYSSGN